MRMRKNARKVTDEEGEGKSRVYPQTVSVDLVKTAEIVVNAFVRVAQNWQIKEERKNSSRGKMGDCNLVIYTFVSFVDCLEP